MLPIEDPLWSNVRVGLEATGVVSGEFGMAEAYKERRSAVAAWLEDADEKVRCFAKKHVAQLDRMIASEQRRARTLRLGSGLGAPAPATRTTPSAADYCRAAPAGATKSPANTRAVARVNGSPHGSARAVLSRVSLGVSKAALRPIAKGLAE